MRITSKALLCHWGQQLLKDMTSLGTDFETHAIWQGLLRNPSQRTCSEEGLHYPFEQSARNPLERDQVQIALGNRPKAVIGQATINLIHKFENPLRIL